MRLHDRRLAKGWRPSSAHLDRETQCRQRRSPRARRTPAGRSRRHADMVIRRPTTEPVARVELASWARKMSAPPGRALRAPSPARRPSRRCDLCSCREETRSHEESKRRIRATKVAARERSGCTARSIRECLYRSRARRPAGGPPAARPWPSWRGRAACCREALPAAVSTTCAPPGSTRFDHFTEALSWPLGRAERRVCVRPRSPRRLSDDARQRRQPLPMTQPRGGSGCASQRSKPSIR